MRKRMVTIGVVLLIVGIAFLVSGVIGLRGSTNTVKVFNQPNPGEYVSSEILLNSSSTIIVRSPPSVGGLIPAQYINLVNSTNHQLLCTYPAATSVAGTECLHFNHRQLLLRNLFLNSTQHKISNYGVTWNNSCIRVANACRHSLHHYWNYSCTFRSIPKAQRPTEKR